MIEISVVAKIAWIVLIGFAGGLVISYNYGWDKGFKSGVRTGVSIKNLYGEIEKNNENIKALRKHIDNNKD